MTDEDEAPMIISDMITLMLFDAPQNSRIHSISVSDRIWGGGAGGAESHE